MQNVGEVITSSDALRIAICPKTSCVLFYENAIKTWDVFRFIARRIYRQDCQDSVGSNARFVTNWL